MLFLHINNEIKKNIIKNFSGNSELYPEEVFSAYSKAWNGLKGLQRKTAACLCGKKIPAYPCELRGA